MIRREIDNLHLGNFETKGKIWVTDPCYKRDINCKHTKELEVQAGVWHAFLDYDNDTGGWGRRVKQLTAYHPHIDPHSANWELVHNDIGVDSGQCGFFDSEAKFEPEGDYDDTSSWYRMCCDLTCGDNQGGIIPGGVVSSSGYGDGSYQLYAATNVAGEICGLRLVFISDYEEEECEC